MHENRQFFLLKRTWDFSFFGFFDSDFVSFVNGVYFPTSDESQLEVLEAVDSHLFSYQLDKQVSGEAFEITIPEGE
jgi:hypothetical protein